MAQSLRQALPCLFCSSLRKLLGLLPCAHGPKFPLSKDSACQFAQVLRKSRLSVLPNAWPEDLIPLVEGRKFFGPVVNACGCRTV